MESRTERLDATRRRENDNAAGVPLFMYVALPCNRKLRKRSSDRIIFWIMLRAWLSD